MARRLGIDVASYQNANTSVYPHDFSFVKLTEGTGYVNPKAVQQIRSTNKVVHGYTFAHAGGDANVAVQEANFALSQHLLKAGSIIAYDYEASASGDINANTNAILAFMRTIKNAGFRPWFYSYVPYIKAHVNIAPIIKEFGNCIWIASYPIAGAVSEPNFNYFPSMNGVAVWQFTDNYRGLGVDGNVEVINGILDIKTVSPIPAPKYKVGDWVTVRPNQIKNNTGYNISGWSGKKIRIKKVWQANGTNIYGCWAGDDSKWPFWDLKENQIQVYQDQAFKVGDWVQLLPTATQETNGYDLRPRHNWIGQIAKATFINRYSNSNFEYQVKWQNGTNNVHVAQQDLKKSEAPKPAPAPSPKPVENDNQKIVNQINDLLKQIK